MEKLHRSTHAQNVCNTILNRQWKINILVAWSYCSQSDQTELSTHQSPRSFIRSSLRALQSGISRCHGNCRYFLRKVGGGNSESSCLRTDKGASWLAAFIQIKGLSTQTLNCCLLEKDPGNGPVDQLSDSGGWGRSTTAAEGVPRSAVCCGKEQH